MTRNLRENNSQKNGKGKLNKWVAVTAAGMLIGAIAPVSVSAWTPRSVQEIQKDVPKTEKITDLSNYNIRYGDTLWGISQATGFSVLDLAGTFRIGNPDLIYAGKTLGKSQSATTSSEDNEEGLEYTVVYGDTLSAIAQAFGTTIDQLVQWNNIKDPNLIFPGQKFQVSENKAEKPNVDNPKPTPGETEKPSNPGSSEKPTNPEKPGNPTGPEKPEETEKPETPSEPEKPTNPVDPEEPETPEEPNKPEKPEEPEVPTEPEIPEEPTDPEKPEEPEVPVEPEEPETPEEPEVPVEPEEPEIPVEPEEPTEPEEPEVPVEPEEPEVPEEGDDVVIVDTDSFSVEENVHYDVEYVETPYLPLGEERVTQNGEHGVRRITYTTTYYSDGTFKTVESSEMIVEPINKIIAVGTRVDKEIARVYTEEEEEIIQFEEEFIYDDKLPEGYVEVMQEGVNGSIVTVYEHTEFVDGTVETRVVEQRQVDAVSKITVIGTKEEAPTIVGREEISESVDIPFETEYIEDDEMYVDDLPIQAVAGQQGKKTSYYEIITYSDGTTERVLIREDIVEPVTEVYYIGTKEHMDDYIPVDESDIGNSGRYFLWDDEAHNWAINYLNSSENTKYTTYMMKQLKFKEGSTGYTIEFLTDDRVGELGVPKETIDNLQGLPDLEHVEIVNAPDANRYALVYYLDKEDMDKLGFSNLDEVEEHLKELHEFYVTTISTGEYDGVKYLEDGYYVDWGQALTVEEDYATFHIYFMDYDLVTIY